VCSAEGAKRSPYFAPSALARPDFDIAHSYPADTPRFDIAHSYGVVHPIRHCAWPTPLVRPDSILRMA